MFSGDISEIIIIEGKSAKGYKGLKENEISSSFSSEGQSLIMTSTAKLKINSETYCIILCSDLTQIKEQCDSFNNSYSVIVISVSIISGAILLFFAKRATKPLNKLAKMADKIADGDYGKILQLNSKDREILELSSSFNTMSKTIAQNIKEIKEAARKKEIFVADFTHELKTPMTSIIGYSQMLKEYNLKENEKRQAAAAILSEAKRLESLSSQLLELYVLKKDRIELNVIDLYAVGKELELSLVFLAKKYNVSFSIDLPKISVLGNKAMLISLLSNLADNAFKASFENKKIEIFAKDMKEFIEIFVKDEGKGVSSENLKLLTEPFFRVDKARSRKLGGAGLGLSLCKEIASLHGSKLNFKSEPSKGTLVSFKLKKEADNNESF